MSKKQLFLILLIASSQFACEAIILYKPKKFLDPEPIGSKLVHSEQKKKVLEGEKKKPETLADPWNLNMIGVNEKTIQAEPHLVGNANVKIAVLSTGVDYNHKDLYQSILVNDAEIKESAAELKLDREDSDGNGLIDDVVGWDVVNGDGFAYDRHGAGTAVAGILAAKATSNTKGVLQSASLYPIKYIDDNGRSDIFKLVLALNIALQAKPDIIYIQNTGTPFLVPADKDKREMFLAGQRGSLTTALKNIEKAGILVVIGSGDGMGRFPTEDKNLFTDNRQAVDKIFARQKNVVVVSSVDEKGKHYPLANTGQKHVHLSAPGVKIKTAKPLGGYTEVTGTAYAAAHVAAAAAVARAKFGKKATAKILASAFATQDSGTVSQDLRAALVSKSGTILNVPKYLERVKKDIQ